MSCGSVFFAAWALPPAAAVDPGWLHVAIVTIALAALAFQHRHVRRLKAALSRAERDAEDRTRTLERKEAQLRFIIESLPVGVTWIAVGQPATRLINPAFCRLIGLTEAEAGDRANIIPLCYPEELAVQAEWDARLTRGDINEFTLEKRYRRRDGKIVWVVLHARQIRDERTGLVQKLNTIIDITERKESEAELAQINSRLITASRLAGMAAVATDVLHSVGNVLNSVNVSVTILRDQIGSSGAGKLTTLNALLQEHASNVAAFLADDPKGRRVLPYLDALAGQMMEKQRRMLTEIESLHRNFEHIKEVVACQQDYARHVEVVEQIAPIALFEEALRITAIARDHQTIKITREFQPTPPVFADRHKVLQILVNLLQNAKQALLESGRNDLRLGLRIESDHLHLRLVVADNGVGIAAENLVRVFAHGFTTRPHAHGFGLHSAANMAKEMKGSLGVVSDGPGRGAAFTLELPTASESRT